MLLIAQEQLSPAIHYSSSQLLHLLIQQSGQTHYNLKATGWLKIRYDSVI